MLGKKSPRVLAEGRYTNGQKNVNPIAKQKDERVDERGGEKEKRGEEKRSKRRENSNKQWGILKQSNFSRPGPGLQLQARVKTQPELKTTQGIQT